MNHQESILRAVIAGAVVGACFGAVSLLGGCSGYDPSEGTADGDGEPVELGTLGQQLITAQCGGAQSQFGANLGTNTGDTDPARCSRSSASDNCYFPVSWFNFAIGANNAELYFGWNATSRSALTAPAIATVAFMDTSFGSKYDSPAGQLTPYVFHTATPESPSSYVDVNNEAVPGFLNSAFNFISFRDVVRIRCANSQPMPDTYAANMRACYKWVATFDYTKFNNYLTARGLTGNQKVIPLTNVLRKIALITNGYGLATDGGSSAVTDLYITTTSYTTTFPGDSLSWLNNYSSSGAGLNLNCVP